MKNKPATASMLSTLAGVVQALRVPVDQYMHHIGECVVVNPFQNNIASAACTGADEQMPDRLWERMGIRRLTLEQSVCKQLSRDCRPGENVDAVPGRWDRIKSEAMITALTGIFNRCLIIEFADWATADDASGCWDGLCSDIIKPLKRKGMQFIFRLGDVAKRPVFEIDEILDIIGDYSLYGKVTLLLDNQEADHLWCRLNGLNQGSSVGEAVSPAAWEKYQFLFNTMTIDVLLVLHGCHAVQVSREGRLNLAGRPIASVHEAAHAKSWFSAGYQMGLLLQLGPMHCMALGLAVLGGISTGAGATMLQSCIQDWMSDTIADGIPAKIIKHIE